MCGYGFLSYETTTEPRLVTCVWCIAGVLRTSHVWGRDLQHV